MPASRAEIKPQMPHPRASNMRKWPGGGGWALLELTDALCERFWSVDSFAADKFGLSPNNRCAGGNKLYMLYALISFILHKFTLVVALLVKKMNKCIQDRDQIQFNPQGKLLLLWTWLNMPQWRGWQP